MLLPKNKESVSILARDHHNALFGDRNSLRSIQHSSIMPPSKLERKVHYGSRNQRIVINTNDTVTDIFAVPEDKLISVLNFASYKTPGGLYLNGSTSQEEFLCHHSNLFEVLNGFRREWYERHQYTLNNGMYTSDAIWCADITFFDYTDPCQVAAGWDSDIKHRNVDVLTIAAPNRGVAIDRRHVPLDMYNEALEDRIYHVLYNMFKGNPGGIIILGAFGCGVFKNDPSQVAMLFRQVIEQNFPCSFEEIRFAIPMDRTNNYKAFMGVFGDMIKKGEVDG